MTRRFPAPWACSNTPSGYRITDAKGVTLTFVYGADTPQGASSDKLTKDEARRIALGIVRLPVLLGGQSEK
jgi:hypothetical protein